MIARARQRTGVRFYPPSLTPAPRSPEPFRAAKIAYSFQSLSLRSRRVIRPVCAFFPLIFLLFPVCFFFIYFFFMSITRDTERALCSAPRGDGSAGD